MGETGRLGLPEGQASDPHNQASEEQGIRILPVKAGLALW